jgi:hypothetical protein
MAEEGAAAPSLGGRFSLWWAVLAAIALMTHWATLTGRSPIAPEHIAFIWITFAIVGVLGNVALGATLRGKPGGSAPGNRVQSAIWPVTTAGLFLYGTALGFGVAMRDLPPILFDTIMPVAFILHAVNSSAAAVLFRQKLPWLTVGASLVTATLCTYLIGSTTTYLVAVTGVILAWIIPAIMTLRAEPKSVI